MSSLEYDTPVVHSSRRHHPDVLKPKETIALLIRCGWKPVKCSRESYHVSEDIMQKHNALQVALKAEIHTQNHQNYLLVRRYRRAIARSRGTVPDQSDSSYQRRNHHLTDTQNLIGTQKQDTKIYASNNTGMAPAQRPQLPNRTSKTTTGVSSGRIQKPLPLSRPKFQPSPHPSGTASAYRRRCQITSSMLHGTSSPSHKFQPPIRTVEELQRKNMRHPGLLPNALTINRIRSELGFANPRYAITKKCSHIEPAETDHFRLDCFIDTHDSSVAYAQASAFKSLASHQWIHANEAVEGNEIDFGPPPYPKVPILHREEAYEPSMLDVMEALFTDHPLPYDLLDESKKPSRLPVLGQPIPPSQQLSAGTLSVTPHDPARVRQNKGSAQSLAPACPPNFQHGRSGPTTATTNKPPVPRYSDARMANMFMSQQATALTYQRPAAAARAGTVHPALSATLASPQSPKTLNLDNIDLRNHDQHSKKSQAIDSNTSHLLNSLSESLARQAEAFQAAFGVPVPQDLKSFNLTRPQPLPNPSGNILPDCNFCVPRNKNPRHPPKPSTSPHQHSPATAQDPSSLSRRSISRPSSFCD